MAIQITIIGMGQIGASVGLALASQKSLLVRVGNDRDPQIARQAVKIGAVDRAEINLPDAVRNADIVLLSLPVDQIRETLAFIAQDLKESAVVIDTGPVKEAVSAWAAEYLPVERHYIGLTPVLNPSYLHDTDSGIDAARADLFHGGLMGIVAPPQSNSEAIKLAADLTRLLGASPLFADPLELDSLMAATHILPQLLAAALLNSTVDQPGWREGRKVAGRAYAEATAPIVHLGEEHALREALLLNRENVLRVLDGALAALQSIRKSIDAGDGSALDENLGRARRGREKWWKERKSSDWTTEELVTKELPEKPSLLGRLFGGGLGSKPKRTSKP